MSDIEKLAEACERATGPDRELDAAILMATGIGTFETRFTASVDEARSLVPEHVFEEIWSGTGRSKSSAQLVYPRGAAIWSHSRRPTSIYVVAASEPLALCAAALRARLTASA